MMEEVRDALDRAVNVIKIEVTGEERKQLAAEMKSFFRWIEPLLAIDTAGIRQVLNCHGALNVMREDKAQQGKINELQKTAPNFEESLYQVPAIIE